MAQNKRFTFGPLLLTTTYTTNILNPPTATGGTNGGSSAMYILIRHIRILNITGTAATFRLFKDATGGNTAGKELIGFNMSVAANLFVDAFFSDLRFDAADFLVGGAGTATALTISGEGEIGVSG